MRILKIKKSDYPWLLRASFGYHARLKEAIKPFSTWHDDSKTWVFPVEMLPVVEKHAKKMGFEVKHDT